MVVSHGALCGLTSSIVSEGRIREGWCFDPPEILFFLSYAAATTVEAACLASNAVPSIHIRCRITASLRASATFMPARLASSIAQLLRPARFTGRVNMTLAAS